MCTGVSLSRSKLAQVIIRWAWHWHTFQLSVHMHFVLCRCVCSVHYYFKIVLYNYRLWFVQSCNACQWMLIRVNKYCLLMQLPAIRLKSALEQLRRTIVSQVTVCIVIVESTYWQFNAWIHKPSVLISESYICKQTVMWLFNIFIHIYMHPLERRKHKANSLPIHNVTCLSMCPWMRVHWYIFYLYI